MFVCPCGTLTMRLEQFEANKYYLVMVVGAGKEKIFIDNEDYSRLIFLITHFQSPTKVYNVSWYTKTFVKKGSFNVGSLKTSEITGGRNIELLAFSLVENSCHLLIKNNADAATSVYMQRVLTAYSKYFNSKYSRSGHVFAGPFKASPIKNSSDLINISAQIHKKVGDEYLNYPWSSFQDYVGFNRWGNLISREAVLGRFRDQMEYIEFVKKNNSKFENFI